MTNRSPLDDSGTSDFAWARYKRLMKWMFAFTLVVVLAALGFVYLNSGMPSVHLYIATALGVGFAMLLMCALMGLVFLSSGTGHDEAVSDLAERDQKDGRKR